jgi:hypothetical protein
MRSWIAVLALMTASLTTLAGRAEACSCFSGGPPCQNYFHVDAVFLGSVQSIAQTDVPQDSFLTRKLVTFTIERPFRGVDGSTVQVKTGMGGGDCGYDFKPGERYLVYAQRTKDGGLYAGICSRTRRAADAAEDLQYLEDLRPTGSGVRVYGTVSRTERDLATGRPMEYGPMPGVRIVVSGPAGDRNARTDWKGMYSIEGLDDGTYHVSVHPPDPLVWSSGAHDLKIAFRDNRACMLEDFGVVFDGRISGNAVSRDGAPASDVPVTLIAAVNANAPGIVPMMSTQTDSSGRYEFTKVPRGRYLVGISLRRSMEGPVVYPRVFYPSTMDASQATVVTVGNGTRQQLEPLQVPPARKARELTGTVTWSDGRPIEGASVSLTDGDADWWRQVAATIRTDKSGGFRFVVHDGLSYKARAWFDIREPKWHQVQATVVPFVASEALAPLHLIVQADPQGP